MIDSLPWRASHLTIGFTSGGGRDRPSSNRIKPRFLPFSKDRLPWHNRRSFLPRALQSESTGFLYDLPSPGSWHFAHWGEMILHAATRKLAGDIFFPEPFETVLDWDDIEQRHKDTHFKASLLEIGLPHIPRHDDLTVSGKGWCSEDWILSLDFWKNKQWTERKESPMTSKLPSQNSEHPVKRTIGIKKGSPSMAMAIYSVHHFFFSWSQPIMERNFFQPIRSDAPPLLFKALNTGRPPDFPRSTPWRNFLSGPLWASASSLRGFLRWWLAASRQITVFSRIADGVTHERHSPSYIKSTMSFNSWRHSK